MKTELDRFLERLEPGSEGTPPSQRLHRILLIETGVRILEMRDPNDGADPDPRSKSRHQYLLAGGLVYSRHLPPEPLGDAWADSGVPPWELLGGTGRPTGIVAEYAAIAADVAPERPPPGCAVEHHDMHGRGRVAHDVYYLPPDPEDYWRAVTDIPCPVPGCGHHVAWWEAGYVPGYRACMARVGGDAYDPQTIRHRFLARGSALAPCLIEVRT